MLPAFYFESNIWIELLKKFEWYLVNLIHSNDLEGKMLASRFKDMAELNNIKVESNHICLK